MPLQPRELVHRGPDPEPGEARPPRAVARARRLLPLSKRALVRGAPLLALAALLALFFAPLAASGRAFVFRDLVVYAAGQDAVLREAILERHELPARNPWGYLSVPHLADPSTQSLYPPRLLCALAFPAPRSLDLAILLHFAIAALGAFRLGRALGAGRAASVAGAAVYALSGPVLSLQENLPSLAGAAWLPWSFAFALEASPRPGGRRARSLALAAATIALACLGGDLQAATWASVLVAGIAIVRALMQKSKASVRAHVVFGGFAASLIGLALAAALLVPAARLRPLTDRRDPLPEAVAGAWSLAPARAAELVVPFPFGLSFPEGETVVRGLDPTSPLTEPWSESLHVGLLGLVLGLAALGDRRLRRAVAGLLGLAVAGYLLALGPRPGAWAPWRLLRAIVPFYDVFRYPEKHTVLVALALSGSAALGIAALASESGRRRATRALLGTAIGLAVGFVALRGILDRALGEVVLASGRPHVPELAGKLVRSLDLQVATGCGALLVAALALAATRERRRLAVLLAATLVAANVALELRPRLFLGDATLYEARPLGADLVHGSGARLLRWPWSNAEPIGRIAPADAEPGRRQRERAIAARVLSWTGNVAARERVSAVQGFASFVPLAVRDALPGGRGLPDRATLDRLGVRWLVLDSRLAEEQGLAPVRSTSTGVALVDRGAGTPRAPEPDFGGEVPGLGVGVGVSALSLALFVVFVRMGRPRRYRSRTLAARSPTNRAS